MGLVFVFCIEMLVVFIYSMRFLVYICVFLVGSECSKASDIFDLDKPERRRSRGFSIPASDAVVRPYYSGEYFGSYDEFEKKRLRPDADLWEYPVERVPGEVFHREFITLASGSIEREPFAVTYIIVENPEWVIKYYSHCGEVANDPIPREAYYMAFVNNVYPDISPTLVYFSRGLVPIEHSLFKLPSDSFSCPEAAGQIFPLVRFIITQRTSETLHEYIRSRGVIPFVESIKLTIRIVHMLSSLHQFRIAHGSISIHNIVFSHGTTRKLMFVNYSAAEFVPQVGMDGSVDDKKLTFSDDLYETIGMLGAMLFGVDGVGADIHGSPHPIASILPDELKMFSGLVENVLSDIIEHVSSLHYGELPHYTFILSALQDLSAFTPPA